MEILHDLKMQFVDLLLVMWIFWGQIGHKTYEDFEHPTCKGRSVDKCFCPYRAYYYNIRLPRALPWARRNLGFQPVLFKV